MSVKDGMAAYFLRLVTFWLEHHGHLPMIEWSEYADPIIYRGERDARGYIEWEPMEKTIKHDLTPVEQRLGEQLHGSIHEYLNSFWFCSMQGSIGVQGSSDRWSLEINPVVPGLEMKEFLPLLIGYRAAHAGRLDHVPVGFESNGLLLVVNNTSGEVEVEDYEERGFEVIAPSLAHCINSM